MISYKTAVLLVEDSPDDERLTLRGVATSGVSCDVSVIRHGGQVVAALFEPRGLTPDLIVLDFHLPGMNGLEILQELRRHKKTRHIPVVMLSSLGSDGDIARCLAAGANSYVQKPLDPRLFMERVGLIVQYWINVDKRPAASLLFA